MTGNQLKEIRINKFNMTQVELALALGKVPATVARWEQQKDDDIPDSRYIELALKGLMAELGINSKDTK